MCFLPWLSKRASEQANERGLGEQKLWRSGAGGGSYFCPLPLLLIYSHSLVVSRAFKKERLLCRLQEPVDVCLPFSLFVADMLLYRFVLPIFCVTVAVRHLCVTVYLFNLQVENYHEHVKMTKLKTASGKEKRSTREVGNELRWPNTVFKSLCLILHNF